MDDSSTQEGPSTKRPAVPLETLLPSYKFADLRHRFKHPNTTSAEKEKIKAELMEAIERDDMLPFYMIFCEEAKIVPDSTLVEKLKKRNIEELESLESKILDVTENYGETEIKDAMMDKAHFFCRIADMKSAVTEYEAALAKTIGIGSRLDTILCLVRIGFVFDNISLVRKNITVAKEELERGGDWERRNKLKVYEAMLLITTRSFEEAALLLLTSIATFTAVELLSFETFIFYTVILAMLTLDRGVLREKVINSPEVLQVLVEDEDLNEFLNSFYDCKYDKFMQYLVKIAHRVQSDRVLGRHFRFFLRRMRLRAYHQFLEPFKSIKLESMANAFGTSVDLIEEEITSFIPGGKLPCRIDKVHGVITSNRPDMRNQLYHQTIQQGDMLLNRIQKLSRVIDM